MPFHYHWRKLLENKIKQNLISFGNILLQVPKDLISLWKVKIEYIHIHPL